MIWFIYKSFWDLHNCLGLCLDSPLPTLCSSRKSQRIWNWRMIFEMLFWYTICEISSSLKICTERNHSTFPRCFLQRCTWRHQLQWALAQVLRRMRLGPHQFWPLPEVLFHFLTIWSYYFGLVRPQDLTWYPHQPIGIH